MFLRYYGLREQPFGMTPDPRFLCSSVSHQEAFASLVYAIETGRGFAALIAKPGMGKTTLLFQLMERLRGSASTAFLFQSHEDSRGFLSSLIADLGLDPNEQDLSSLQRQLDDVLVREAHAGRRFVLVIDEAQNLADSVLESVRMLSNFETPQAKLIHIVLSGQPELANKLMRPELAQLRQRVSVIAHLNSLTEPEVAHYIGHRLKVAGYHGAPLFTKEALAIIANRSEGIPRNINNLCFHALSLGFAKGQKRIDRSIMAEVLLDLNMRRLGERPLYDPNPETEPGGNQTASRSEAGRISPRESDSLSIDEVPLTPATLPRSQKRGSGSPFLWAAGILVAILCAGFYWNSPFVKSRRAMIGQSVSGVIQESKQAADMPSPAAQSPAKPAPQPSAEADSQLNDLATERNSKPQGLALDPSTNTNSGLSPAGVPENGTPQQEQDKGLEASPAFSEEASTRSFEAKGRRQHHHVRFLADDSRDASDSPHGQLVVESSVSGGKIRLNGRSRPDWVTPHMFSLAPGTYRVEVTKGGYPAWRGFARVAEGTKSWTVAKFAPPKGVFVVETDPPGMQVFIDGQSYGRSEVQTTLPAGEHTYQVVPPSGLQPYLGTFRLEGGHILVRKVTWRRRENPGKQAARSVSRAG